MLQYIEIEGLRKNSSIIYVECEKQLYRKNCLTKKYCVYKCREDHCKSRVKIDLQSRVCTKVKNFQPHNHSDREQEFHKIRAISKIKKDCADPRIPRYRGFAVANTRQVFDETVSEFQLDPEQIDYNKMQRTLVRIRQSVILKEEEAKRGVKMEQIQQPSSNNEMPREPAIYREEESHLDTHSAEDNNMSEDDNDNGSSQDDWADNPTIDYVSYDPLNEPEVPKESIARSSPNCPAPANTSVAEDIVKDEHSLVGQVVTTKLKTMDINQQIIAEKLISDVLYYGRLGMLEIDTRLQNLKLAPT